MPQMSPLMWMILMLLSLSLVFLNMIKLNYMFKPSSPLAEFSMKTSSSYYNWKW